MLVRLFTAVISMFVLPTFACTTFEVSDHDRVVTAKRFDFVTDLALISTHRRGETHTALVHSKFIGSPVSWTSKFGSITFDIQGAEFPVEGMNEKGLVMESLHNYGTIFPTATGNLPYISNRQLVQYVLDLASNLDEALNLIRNVYVQPLIPHDQHFFVCDAKKSCAVVEYINGQLVVVANNQLIRPLITNYPYQDSVLGLPDRKGDTRYTRASKLLSVPPRGNIIDYAFSITDQIAIRDTQGGSETGWEVVYDQQRSVVHFRSDESPKHKWIDLNKIDFSQRGMAMMIDVHSSATGDVTKRLVPYDKKLDVGYIRNFMFGFGYALETDYPGITAAMIAYPFLPNQPAL